MNWCRHILKTTERSPNQWGQSGILVRQDGEVRSAFRILEHFDVSLETLCKVMYPWVLPFLLVLKKHAQCDRPYPFCVTLTLLSSSGWQWTVAMLVTW